ncbi:hypothetical protein BJ170DRAFT_678603 [Xylariales sp. AK1849]|nr:hypothetical protein BJ170DRAFT_678603 [Xylariales sp. AK1849]
MPTLTPLRTALRSTRAVRLTTPISVTPARHLQTTARLRAYKDDQDRESLKPKAHEYTQSGTDEGAAAQEDAAFNPDKTSPESAKETAGQGQEGNELGVSPADKGVAEGGRGKEEDKPKQGGNKQSGGGSAPKGSKIQQ